MRKIRNGIFRELRDIYFKKGFESLEKSVGELNIGKNDLIVVEAMCKAKIHTIQTYEIVCPYIGLFVAILLTRRGTEIIAFVITVLGSLFVIGSYYICAKCIEFLSVLEKVIERQE